MSLRPQMPAQAQAAAARHRPCKLHLFFSVRTAAGSAVHSVRVEAEYDWPSDRIFSVAREFDVVGSHNRFALVSFRMNAE